MKRTLLMAFILFFLVSALAATDPVKPVLKKGDVKKFIKTFPLLKEDFERFGAQYDSQSAELTYPEALKANSEFRGILKKHGWDEHFFTKASVIALGYAIIASEKGTKDAGSGLEQSLKEIDANPHLSEAMKKQLKEQIKGAQGSISTQNKAMKSQIDQADMDLIRPLYKELDEVFKEE